jgi:hypothetical protein
MSNLVKRLKVLTEKAIKDFDAGDRAIVGCWAGYLDSNPLCDGRNKLADNKL